MMSAGHKFYTSRISQ